MHLGRGAPMGKNLESTERTFQVRSMASAVVDCAQRCGIHRTLMQNQSLSWFFSDPHVERRALELSGFEGECACFDLWG